MGFMDFFRKKTDDGPDPLKDLTLSNIKVGFFLDYDLQTWQVEAYNYYDWGGGDKIHEWRLKSHDDVIYLEKESDDEAEWCISRPVAMGRLGSGIADHIIQNDDPPEEIVFEGETYYLESSGAGHFFKDGKGPGKEFVKWEFEDDSGEKYITISQWGETDFEASVGNSAQEYQFTNILPIEEKV